MPVPENGWGTLACKLVYNRALYSSVVQATYTNLVLLTVERYVAVVHPLKHRRFTPALNALAIFLSWSTGVVRVIYRYIEPERSGTGCIAIPTEPSIFPLITTCWTLYIPVAVIAGLNGRILFVLRRQNRAVRPQPTNNPATVAASASVRTKLQRELTSSVCIICLMSIIMSTPLAMVVLLMGYGVIERDFRGILIQVVAHLSSTFYTINPAICIFQIHSIRRELVAMFRCRRMRGRGTGFQMTGTSVTGTGTATTNVATLEEL